MSSSDKILKHLEVHKQRFAAEVAQRPGLLRYLSRDAPARQIRMTATYAMRNGAVLLSLRSAVKALTIHPLTAKNLRLPLHLVKAFLFYATPLRRARRPLQRLLGQPV